MNSITKKIVLISVLLIQSVYFQVFAQSPQKFSYQAVIRDASGKIAENKLVNIRISILQGSSNGSTIFKEEHSDTTNVNGLVSLQIGSKIKFNIDWSKGPFFIKTELKNLGEANYVDYGTTQMLSVPYALYAEKSGSSATQGPKGDKGDTGLQGLSGKDGFDGKDGLQGLQGPKGDKGDLGLQGLPGKDGFDGKDGVQGLQGPKGDKGNTGLQGLSGKDGLDGKDGIQGPKGDKGDLGLQGLPGKDGLDGKDGLQGLQGPKGDKGDTGLQGLSGKDGLDGKDGAQGPKGDSGLPGKDGLDGKDGAQGLKGDKGDTGLQGLPGKDGMDGKDGAQGPKGDKGDIGLQGLPGKDGMDGKDGAQGLKGDKGDTGLQGLPGKDGMDGMDGKDGAQGLKGDKGIDGKVEFQNLRVSKSGDTLYLTNGNFVIIPGVSAANIGTNTIPTSGYGPNITDIDGNTYKTVYIGTQQWMAENLRVSKYNNGDLIPYVSDSASWCFRSSHAFCYPNNDSNNNLTYGKFYNIYAVVDSRKLCPAGWHVSTDAEWTILTDYLGGEGVAGGKLKEIGTINWRSPNPGATNEYNFNAVGTGVREHNGFFYPFKETTYFWTPTLLPNSVTQYFGRRLDYGSVGIDRYNNGYPGSTGFSIRCLKDNTNIQPTQGTIQNIDCGNATNNGTLTTNTAASGVNSVITYTGGNGGSYSDQTVSSTGVTGLTATISSGSFANGNGTLTYTILGTPTSSGTATFTLNIGGKTCNITREVILQNFGFGPNITDIDGNTYKTVYIGSQQWMAENLRVSKYNNGDIIPHISDSATWAFRTSNAFCYPNNDPNNDLVYGKLYNIYTVVDSRKLCPAGWHVSTDAEWTILTDYLGGEGIAGGKLKEIGTFHWRSPNPGATNDFNFNAVGAGFRDGNGSFYSSLNQWAYFWTSTLRKEDTRYYFGRWINYQGNGIARYNNGYDYPAGMSVRCIKD